MPEFSTNHTQDDIGYKLSMVSWIAYIRPGNSIELTIQHLWVCISPHSKVYSINLIISASFSFRFESLRHTSVITLHRTAALASPVNEVLLYCTCASTSTCQTRQCKCFKSNAKCTNYCHQRKHHLDDQAGSCLNLAAAMERNTCMVISRGILPAP